MNQNCQSFLPCWWSEYYFHFLNYFFGHRRIEKETIQPDGLITNRIWPPCSRAWRKLFQIIPSALLPGWCRQKHISGVCAVKFRLLRETKGSIHLTEISGNSGTKSNGTERFWKFVSKIVDNLRRLSFFLEIWKFRKFPVPFGISTRFESTPVPLVVKSYKMATSKSVESTLHWMQNDLPRLEPVLDRKRKR